MSGNSENKEEITFIPGHAYICTFIDNRMPIGGKSYLGIYEGDYFAMIGTVFLEMRNIKFTPDYFSTITPAENINVADFLYHSNLSEIELMDYNKTRLLRGY